MRIIFIDQEDIVEVISLCTGPTNIWTQFALPSEPWSSGRTTGDPKLNFNGRNHDAADAIVLDSCEIFVAGYVFWYTGVYGNSEYSRVFSVSTNGGGTFSDLQDFYGYTAGTQAGAYDPLYWTNQINSVALAKNGNTVYVLHNTADNNQYQFEPPPLENFLITSVTTDLGLSWTHNFTPGYENQISTTEAIYTQNGLFHVGGDTKTTLERNESRANLYVSQSTDEGLLWNTTLVLDNTQAYPVSDYGYSRLATSIANVNGYCGILLNGWNTSTGNSVIYYLNPTSNTSWDIKTLYDHDSGDNNYYFYNEPSADYNRMKLLSLQNEPGTLLAFYGDQSSRIHRLRSTDSGNTWSAPSQVYPITVFDEITPDVTFSRWSWGPLINIKQEYYPNSGNSPLGVEWNIDGWSDLSNVTTRTYGNFVDLNQNWVGANVKTHYWVMHTIESDRYFKFKFTDWGNAKTGASFVYNRQEIDSTGANISGVVTVTKPVTELIYDIDRIGFGPNFDAVELANGNVVVVLCAQVPNPDDMVNFDAIKYVISTDGGNNFNQHGWATTATDYNTSFSSKFNNYGYKALASGNDVMLVGATNNQNNAIRFTPQAGAAAPPQPALPVTAPFIMEFDPSINTGISININGPAHVEIDWGNGQKTIKYNPGGGSQTASHDYGANISLKEIRIVGKTTGINFFNSSGFTAVKSWGNLQTFSEINFNDCVNLARVPNTAPANVTNYTYMFAGTGMNDSNISTWDTSNVTNMSYMFYNATAFNQDINSWNTGNLTTAEAMFSGATSFNQSLNSWNISNVLNTSQMFYNATSFNGNISLWDTGNVTNMTQMFTLTPFNQDIGAWNVSNVTNMTSMFSSASAFNQDIGAWDTGNVTAMTGMFSSALVFNQDIGSWNVSNVTNMDSMFTSAEVFNQNLSAWCVTNIPSEPSLFRFGATAWTLPKPIWGVCPGTPMILEYNPILNTSVDQPNAGIAFYGAVNGLVNWGDGQVDVITNSVGQFYKYHDYGSNTSLKTITITGSMPGEISFPNGSRLGYTKVVDWGNLGASYISLDQCINLSNVPNVAPPTTNFYNLFYGCENFNDANVNLWNVSNVTNMNQMFKNATAFNQDISGWSTSNVTNMSQMFWAANTFNQDLSSWCVSNFGSEPSDFSTGATAWTLPKPVWGTCPTQVPNTLPMILTWSPSGASSTVVLQFSGNVNTRVNWGDGNIQTVSTTSDLSHTYSSSGSYTISIKGQTDKFSLFSTNKAPLVAVNDFGGLLNLSSLYQAFIFCTGLASVPNTLPGTVSNVSGMFFGCSSLNDANITLWDTSNITDMNRLFYSTPFNKALGFWNTSNVTDMSFMFTDTPFNQNIGSWDTGNVVNMRNMFKYAPFNQNISAWNVSNVTNMEQMFASTSFNQNLSSWDTGKVTNMSQIFYGTPFNQNIGAWNTGNVTNMSYMFYDTSFNQDISSWNTGNVTNMQYMFANDAAFNQDLSGWCVTNISSEPTGFSTGTTAWTLPKPVWGTCP